MTSNVSSTDPLLLPVQLDAFILNPSVCGQPGDKNSRIAPLTAPNYTFLRLDNETIQSDVQPHSDLHGTAPAKTNTRVTDLGAQPEPAPRRNRHGVYVSWTLPRMYRSGVAMADSVSAERDKEEREKKGLPPLGPGEKPDAATQATPEFVEVPTRWLVVRKIDLESIKPVEAKGSFKEYRSWVIESNYRWNLDDIPLEADLQVDVSPFVFGVGTDDIDQNHINQQAETFIGRRYPAESWTEKEKAGQENPHHLPLSLLRSSNQLFADYQPHNSNVFSMLDNFAYGASKNTEAKYLESATASYYIIGWHSIAATDPFGGVESTFTHQERLDSLFLTHDATDNEFAKPWLDAKDSVNTVCHGAMYDVKWDWTKKPDNVPADAYSKRMLDPAVPAVAIGTTPMDSIISYISGRKGAGSHVEDLEESVLAIEALLHQRDEGVEGQREAMDTVYNWNFNRRAGGSHYTVSGEDKSGQQTKPSDATLEAVADLNVLQDHLDGAMRAADQYRWDMFSTWWKYVSGVQMDDNYNDGWYKDETAKIGSRIDRCVQKVKDVEAAIQAKVKAPIQVPDPLNPGQKTDGPILGTLAQKGTMAPFFQAKDPTVLVGGIPSGWAVDFGDKLAFRLPAETIGLEDQNSLATGLKDLIASIAPKMPAGVAAATPALLAESQALAPKADGSPTNPDLKKHQLRPVFHDTNSSDATWRDLWNDRQPWFPLFTEWEIEYTHIPYKHWSLDEHTARASVNKMIRYGIHTKPTDTTAEYDPLFKVLTNRDVRLCSGRSLILPQPSFSLASKIEQLFSDTPETILEEYLSKEKQVELLAGVRSLAYLSSPLSGLFDNLVTLSQGSHIKPENRAFDPDHPLAALAPTLAALFPDAGFTSSQVGKIQGQSSVTPFGGSARFPSTEFCPFKPVTHGQFRFRKFNIIDKFGQTLVLISPDPQPKGHWDPIYPCISDFYEPQLRHDNPQKPDTVIEDDINHCEFMQMPPQINQPARLNSTFVMRETDPEINKTAYWKPAGEWDNPIWGWAVVNYADYGIQFFLQSGVFYREVRIGGPNGTLTEPAWIPFAPGESALGADTAQLDALIAELQDPDYIKGFWEMITRALDSLPAAPNSYAEYMSSLVGKPLALANAGWALEIAGPQYLNQASKSAVANPDRWLLDGHSQVYDFQIKFGDKERAYDGLIGYFDSVPNADLIKRTKPDTELKLDKVHTYFYPDISGPPPQPLAPIIAPNYPSIRAGYIDPIDPNPASDFPVPTNSYTALRNRRLSVYGVILDPFTPIHAYSSFLPPTSLQLGPWMWQEAMKRMMAFFHMGPLTLVHDIPAYAPERKLTTDNMDRLLVEQPPVAAQFPGLASADWNWLQPYVEGEDLDKQPAFNAIALEVKGNLLKPGFQQGPYTAVEGFLLLKKRLLENSAKVEMENVPAETVPVVG